MCYDVKSSLRSQLKRAKHYGDTKKIAEIEKELAPLTDLPIHHRQGHSHPKLLIYTNESPEVPVVSQWGLVPFWVKDNTQRKSISKSTLNARGETIFEKASFRDSAKKKRCLIYVDGFYEHHHFKPENESKAKTYPFYIHRKDGEPIIFAGLWSEWLDKETGELINTFSIVTTEGNDLLTKIHNNPKLKGPRMPVILPDELADKWLNPNEEELDKQVLEDLIKPYPEEELTAYTVGRLRGKDYAGNVEEISNEVVYEELVF
ncbi:SOS response-associated peptidase [Aquimarina litoralis]|uniref:SOS response-associated peptidase n=1 Tax=Aquimarina litoralis TaxID=584605 RepID=UPI001C58E169|nr:SOS response-associated peptidase [Aquimarina litoralis]MBW1297829.1 SOS response-associated peptidase [Aquimarina litoralis]